MPKEIIAIWAQDETGVIGIDGHMPWHLPAELQHFKKRTTGHAILMGRVTFEGMGKRLLPNRQSLILTHDQNYEAPGALVVHSVQEALDWYAQQDKTLFITGGAGIYQAFKDHYDSLCQTVIAHRFEGDTHFPDLDLSAYALVASQTRAADDKNAYAFTVRDFKKKEQ